MPISGRSAIQTSVASLTVLANLPTTGLQPGEPAYVQDTKRYFYLDRTSSLPVSGDVVAAQGGGQWVFSANASANAALSQAAWFVDAVNGNDGNTGATTGTALQTFQEILRRWGPNPVLPQTTTITVLSTVLLPTDQWIVRSLATTTIANNLILRGTVFPGANLGAVTAVTPINHAAAGGDCFLYVTIGAITWPAAKTRLRILGGARDGAVGYVVTPNTAAGQARCTPFSIIPPGTNFDYIAGGAGVKVAPQVGDVIIVETVSRSQKPGQVLNCDMTLVVENMRFDDDAAFTLTNFDMVGDFTAVTLNHCSFGDGSEVNNGTAYYNGCDVGNIINQTKTPCRAISSLSTQLFGTCVEGSWALDGDTCLSGGNIVGLVGAIAPELVLGNVGFVGNSAQACITFFADGIARLRPFDETDGVSYGVGNQSFYKVRAATGKMLVQDIATSINMTFSGSFATIAAQSVNTIRLYPEDNKGNIIASPAADPTTTLGADVYPISKLHTAKNVCLTNQNIAAFVLAGNDGILNATGDTVVLLAQTTASQNGPWLVTGGGAPLVRPDWWQHLAPVPNGSKIAIQQGNVYANVELTAEGISKAIDADDPFLIPTKVIQQVQLGNGTIDITNVPIRDATKVFVGVSRITPNGTATTVQYNPSTITAGELVSGTPKVTVQAQLAAGGINVADTSILNVSIEQ